MKRIKNPDGIPFACIYTFFLIIFIFIYIEDKSSIALFISFVLAFMVIICLFSGIIGERPNKYNTNDFENLSAEEQLKIREKQLKELKDNPTLIFRLNEDLVMIINSFKALIAIGFGIFLFLTPIINIPEENAFITIVVFSGSGLVCFMLGARKIIEYYEMFKNRK